MLGPNNEGPAKSALGAYPGGLQIGGGITNQNAKMWLDAGASKVIVTSYLFEGGEINYERLEELVHVIGGKENLVIDLSCRRKPDGLKDEDDLYYVVTDRWQTYTSLPITAETLSNLSKYCCEFLVHGVENEGKRCGILSDLVSLLGEISPIPVTYAGGVSSLEDLERVSGLGGGKVDLTVGSALDIFGGSIKYDDVVEWHKKNNGVEGV